MCGLGKLGRLLLVVMVMVVALGATPRVQAQGADYIVCKNIQSVIVTYGDGSTYDEGRLHLEYTETITSPLPFPRTVFEHKAYWNGKLKAHCINYEVVQFKKGAWWAQVKRLVLCADYPASPECA